MRSVVTYQWAGALKKCSPRNNAVTLLELAQSEKVPVMTSCGGMGTCGACAVVVIGDNFPEMNEVESEHFSERGEEFGDPSLGKKRLACQVEVPADGASWEVVLPDAPED